MMLLKTLLIIAIFCLVEMSPSNLSLSSFCYDYPHGTLFTSQYHPISVPELHIPWVWEAVHDELQQFVDITFMYQYACAFDTSAWSQMAKIFPHYQKFLADGSSANIFVDPNCMYPSQKSGIFGQSFTCAFNFNNQIVERRQSYRIVQVPPNLGLYVVRCPVSSGIAYDTMHLEVNNSFTMYCGNAGRPTNRWTNATKAFPVCRLPSYDKQHKQYDLSIVSATSRIDREKIIEWIEYHKLLGVQHFFLYNTAVIPEVQNRIKEVLSPYVKEGVVSLIPWYFMNCVRGMGSGRATHYVLDNPAFNASLPVNQTNKKQLYHRFKPPHPIANYAALASAYTRFRHTSTYILYVDDDEFISLSSNNNTINDNNLVEVANKVFKENPTSHAIAFHPIDMNDCPLNDKHNRRRPIKTLPRVGNMMYGFIGNHHEYEYKLLMRTDSVVYFSVHYASLVEENFHNITFEPIIYHMPMNLVALLHYKLPAHISLDPFSTNLLPIRNVSQSHSCQYSHLLGGLKDIYNVNVSGHVLLSSRMNELVNRYNQRIKIIK